MTLPTQDDIFREFPALDTPRLHLRRLAFRDAHDVHVLYADPGVCQHTLYEPLGDVAQARSLIAECFGYFERRERVNWAIVLRANQKLVGQVGLHSLCFDARRAALGFEISSLYWRQGFMREALRAVLSFAFDSCRLNKLEARASAENHPCHAVLTSVGFRCEGVLRAHVSWKGQQRDIHCFGLLQSEHGSSASEG